MSKQREALELARDVIAGFIEGADPDCGEPDCGDCKAYRPAWAALPAINAALAEPEPEPVAWVEVADPELGPYTFHGMERLPTGKHNLYASPVAAPAPAQISEQQIINLFQDYLNDHKNDGRQVSPRTGAPGYDECEWEAFEYAARAVLAAQGGK